MPADALTTKRLRPDPRSNDQIVVDVHKGTAPAVVYLHGMTSNRTGDKSEHLLAYARARDLGFARFDFRAHGESDGQLDSLKFSQLVEDTLAVIAEVGPCVLVGSSMGALAASWTAAQHPEDVAALVMLSPALGFLGEMARASGSFELRRSDEKLIEFANDALRDAEQFDENKLPNLLNMPVCIVHGSADTTVPLNQSRGLCAAIPHLDKELWVIEGGSHSLNEALDIAFRHVGAFLEQRGITPRLRESPDGLGQT